MYTQYCASALVSRPESTSALFYAYMRYPEDSPGILCIHQIECSTSQTGFKAKFGQLLKSKYLLSVQNERTLLVDHKRQDSKTLSALSTGTLRHMGRDRKTETDKGQIRRCSPENRHSVLAQCDDH